MILFVSRIQNNSNNLSRIFDKKCFQFLPNSRPLSNFQVQNLNQSLSKQIQNSIILAKIRSLLTFPSFDQALKFVNFKRFAVLLKKDNDNSKEEKKIEKKDSDQESFEDIFNDIKNIAKRLSNKNANIYEKEIDKSKNNSQKNEKKDTDKEQDKDKDDDDDADPFEKLKKYVDKNKATPSGSEAKGLNILTSLFLIYLVYNLVVGGLMFMGVIDLLPPTPWSVFLNDFVLNDNIFKIIVTGDTRVTVIGRNKQRIFLSVPSSEYFVKKLEEDAKFHNFDSSTIPIEFKSGHESQQYLNNAFWTFIVLLTVLSIASMRRSFSSASKMDMNSLFKMMGPKSKVKTFKKSSVSDVKFSDVKGCDEAKAEIKEFVEFLKNPEMFKKLGARIPRGAILHGPPGTGKTLLAKAVAGEANVPFFFASGSEFIEMFVGVGAMRVRELFEKARQASPAIIFIDEIDAIGNSRSSNKNYGNMESDQTLNQLLVELDGFTTDSNIIVLCGTNRYDQLDRALIRPGRLDRKIYLAPPDFKGRKELFSHYLSKVTVDPNSIEEFSARLSGLTPGSTGADISSIVNEAAILAARDKKTTVALRDLENSIDRLIMGNKLNKHLSVAEKHTVAVHECGHTLVSWFLKNTLPLLKVSIVPRGQALGVNQFLPSEEYLSSKEDILDMMSAILGGRAAEDVIIGKISTGASDDLLKVTEMAYKQVGVYGMDEEIGNLAFPSMYQKFSRSTGMFPPPSEYSQDMGNKIDKKVHAMVERAYAISKKLITDKKDLLLKLAEELKTKEVLSAAEIEAILGPRPTGARTITSVMSQSVTTASTAT